MVENKKESLAGDSMQNFTKEALFGLLIIAIVGLEFKVSGFGWYDLQMPVLILLLTDALVRSPRN